MLHPGFCLFFCRPPQDLPGQSQPNFLPVHFYGHPQGRRSCSVTRFQLARLVRLLAWRGFFYPGKQDTARLNVWGCTIGAWRCSDVRVGLARLLPGSILGLEKCCGPASDQITRPSRESSAGSEEQKRNGISAGRLLPPPCHAPHAVTSQRLGHSVPHPAVHRLRSAPWVSRRQDEALTCLLAGHPRGLRERRQPLQTRGSLRLEESPNQAPKKILKRCIDQKIKGND